MIQSVLYTSVLHWMFVFRLPDVVVSNIETLFSQFLWKEGRFPSVSWAQCCLPCVDEGLGLRRVEDCNIVGILKCFWQFISGRDALWVHWMTAKYLVRHSFWQVAIAQHPSWPWRGLLTLRPRMIALVSLDSLVWLPDPTWGFSSASAWKAVAPRGLPVPWASSVWFPECCPQFASMFWLLMRGRITQDRLRHLGLYIISRCPLCCSDYEM